MIERVHLAIKRGHPKPYELIRWEFVERFGWTLDEVDALSVGDIHQYIMVQMGRNKAK